MENLLVWNSPISRTETNELVGEHFYHRNTLYHVFALTDETGAIAEAVQNCDAYGKVNALTTGAGRTTAGIMADDVLASNFNNGIINRSDL